MIGSAVLAALHYLTLALGLGSIFMRGRYIRALIGGSGTNIILPKLFAADAGWGIAAALWLATGLARVFTHAEKGSEYYLHSTLFWVKMGLFILTVILEFTPMITFIKWRTANQKSTVSPTAEQLRRLRIINDLQCALVCAIPFVASLMARGIGY